MLPYYFLLVIYSFFSDFSVLFVKNRKKYGNFLQFFLSLYQQVTKNLKKKLL